MYFNMENSDVVVIIPYDKVETIEVGYKIKYRQRMLKQQEVEYVAFFRDRV